MHTCALRASSNRTGGALCSPIPHVRLKFTQFHGDGRAAFAGIPSPENQRSRHVLHDLLDTAMSVPLWILK
jgi:hypothetical protein